MSETGILIPRHEQSIETAVVRALMTAVDALDRAKRETGNGAVLKAVDRALDVIRAATKAALLERPDEPSAGRET